MTQSLDSGFAHQRLDCYAVAQELAAGVVRLARRLPRGYADLRDQLNRSALATVRHIAEGANRVSPADKRQRFVVARGECGELDASLDTAARLGLVSDQAIGSLRELADRVGAMLTGLVRRETARRAEPRASAGCDPARSIHEGARDDSGTPDGSGTCSPGRRDSTHPVRMDARGAKVKARGGADAAAHR